MARVQETIADLFETCLGPASPRPASTRPDTLSPAESFVAPAEPRTLCGADRTCIYSRMPTR
jgi:hypothetical protein